MVVMDTELDVILQTQMREAELGLGYCQHFNYCFIRNKLKCMTLHG